MPTFETLFILKRDLFRNATSAACTLGGGQHGYLGIILGDVAYANEAGNDAAGLPQPFVPPVFPGARAIVDGPDAETRVDQRAAFKDNTYDWNMYTNMQGALCTLITNAVEEVYLSPPQNPITGYKNVTANNLLCHLFVEYGEIGPRETQANEQHFNEAWDGAELFETIITRMTDWVAYATSAGKPYTDAQILDRAELIVLNTGLYDDDMKEWGRMTCAEQTYGNFYGE